MNEAFACSHRESTSMTIIPKYFYKKKFAGFLLQKEINHLSKIKNSPLNPFTAIIGQEEMKLALILNVIDPRIGGVMIMGDRGTGKSTTIRAVADLLPEIQVVAGDAFNSSVDDFE